MEMGKLTKYEREDIARRAVAGAFEQREAELAVAADALAREAYNVIVPLAEQKLAAKLPANWLRRDNCLRYNVGGQDITLCVEGEGFLVPYRAAGSSEGSYSCNRQGVIPHGELCDRIQAHAILADQTKNEKRAAYRATLAMLESIGTTTKLHEVWPQGAPFYSPLASKPAGLPAVRVNEVNAMLGLAEAA
jgi:hypothetical protein